VSENDRYRLSFGAVAELYERARPPYSPDAVAWAAERLEFGRVLDLGAGTGRLTRQLVDAGADAVVALEPDPGMRAVLARLLPDVELVDASAEAIPLPDGSVDAVTAGEAFHWFRLDETLPEIHRVLRRDGGVALFWTLWDDDDPLFHRLNALVNSLRAPVSREAGVDHPLRHSALFGNLEWQKFPHVQVAPKELLIERVMSSSAVITAVPEERKRVLDDVAAMVPDGDVRCPLITTVGVADRV
jgi:SAM-dependent methyltransferase